MWWFQQGLCILPVALVLWTAATFIFAYVTAVVLRHVDPLVPYISDTGTVAPERCVFGIMLDMSAFLGVATMYVRYKQVQALTDEEESKLHKLNVLGLVLGWTSSFGMCIVTNFQGLCILPVALVLWTAATFIFAYVTAVVLRHVDPLVPYISDTGTVAPERCVFGIMLDMSAFLGVATMYVRYKQVQALTDEEESKLHKLNVLGLVLGWTSSFGMCIVTNFQGLCILPVALVLWTAATFIFAYVTAVVLRHVDPLVPYISDTGTVAPERCVFGIMLDMSAFLGVATMYVRYKQVQALTDEEESKLHKLNVLGLVLGWTSSFGMCIVANFQTLVSLYMQPHVHGKSIFWVRLSIGVWTFASIISMFVSSVIMYSSLPGVDVAHKLHWIPGETLYPRLPGTTALLLISFIHLLYH
ncbi:unnamed protein product [Coregonus sp. 'balchen']|nr:unnamed protein product [Coregonus sp. 'balchen']